MQTVYKNVVFSVEEESVNRKGKRYMLYRVRYPDVAVLLPIIGRDEILIERQFRGVIGRYMYEIPAGKVRRGENPISCARRELEEETGYRAGSIKPLLVEYPGPGVLSEKRYHFLATNLKKGKRALDRDEDIVVEKMKIKKVVRLIKSHRITDAKTIIAVLFYAFGKD